MVVKERRGDGEGEKCGEGRGEGRGGEGEEVMDGEVLTVLYKPHMPTDTFPLSSFDVLHSSGFLFLNDVLY